MTETFRSFCEKHAVTYREADALAYRLAQMRAQRLYELLRPSPRWTPNEVYRKGKR